MFPHLASVDTQDGDSSLMGSRVRVLVPHIVSTNTVIIGRWGSNYQLVNMKVLIPYLTFADPTMIEVLGCLVPAWWGCKSRLPLGLCWHEQWCDYSFFLGVWLEYSMCCLDVLYCVRLSLSQSFGKREQPFVLVFLIWAVGIPDCQILQLQLWNIC